MASSRQDRMGQRLRGAQRHQVAEDVSFGIIIPDAGDENVEPPSPLPLPEVASEPTPTPAKRTPNTSAKRKRLDEGSSASSAVNQLSQTRQPTIQLPNGNLANRRSPDVTDTSLPHVVSTPAAINPTPRETEVSNQGVDLWSGQITSPEEATPRSRHSTQVVVEVTESPVEAPGSGRRRDVLASRASLPSRILQEVLQSTNDEEDGPYLSSPLLRKAQRSASASSRRGTRRSPRLALEVNSGELEDLSAGEEVPEPVPLEEEGAADQVADEVQEAEDSQLTQDAVEEAGPAEQIEGSEAARWLRTKRRRHRSPALSPILGYEDPVSDEPARKRQHSKRGSSSLENQRPHKSKPKQKPKLKPKPAAKTKNPKKNKRDREETPGQETGEIDEDNFPIAITVQRFTRRPRAAADEDTDPLTAMDIPLTSRSGVNTVDVLWQLCHDTIDLHRDALMEVMENADGKSKKKEFRIQILALEAFREELEKRFLEHTIILDNLYTLTKRVRKVQKERDALRNEVLQMRAEREEVYETIELIRTQHEAEDKDALRRLNLSSAISEVEIAVERGKNAPEPSDGARKIANLANLEAQVARLTGQVCSRSVEGGILKQIRNFNSFLERAAVALKSK